MKSNVTQNDLHMNNQQCYHCVENTMKHIMQVVLGG